MVFEFSECFLTSPGMATESFSNPKPLWRNSRILLGWFLNPSGINCWIIMGWFQNLPSSTVTEFFWDESWLHSGHIRNPSEISPEFSWNDFRIPMVWLLNSSETASVYFWDGYWILLRFYGSWYQNLPGMVPDFFWTGSEILLDLFLKPSGMVL